MTYSILVTGTSGFLGGSLGKHLRQQGYHVTGISRRESRHEAVDKHISHDLVEQLPDGLPPFDVIFHAAALTSPWAHPDAFESNIEKATSNLVSYAKKHKVKRFINISSTSVHYVMDDQENISEETPLPEVPINNYSKAKRKAEEYVLRNIPEALSVRPRAIYGPGDTVLFPRLLRAAKKGVLPKIIREDGETPKSDLIYIGNLVHMLEQAIKIDLSGVINVTDNDTVDTNELLQKVLQSFGYSDNKLTMNLKTAMRMAKVAEWVSKSFMRWKEPPITQFGVSSIVHTKTFNVKKMLEAFGQPKYSTEEGVDEFIKWYKNHTKEKL